MCFIVRKNEMFTYLPIYEDLFENQEEEQAYISRLIEEGDNYKQWKEESWGKTNGTKTLI